MKLLQKLGISLFALCAISTASFAATATVDVDRVLFEYSKSKVAAAQFKAQEEGLQNMILEAQKKIKATSSPVEQKNLEASYEKKIKAQADKIKSEQMKRLQEIEDDVMKAIQKTNKGKYDLILKKSATIYCPNDITDAVLQQLNSNPAR